MSWNYRVIYHKAGALTETSKIKWDEYLAVHEVYYKEDKISSITERPIVISGEEGKDFLNSINSSEFHIFLISQMFPKEYFKS